MEIRVVLLHLCVFAVYEASAVVEQDAPTT